ncbi:MAG: hypothetical protein J6U54_15350 [Clostridiales bacterium]|nr:hypothetical protein [Clostridiales bacterium]
MIDRQKIFCQGGKIFSKVLKAISASGVRVHGIEQSSGDAWCFGYSIRHATSIGYDCGPDFFENHGYQKVDPFTFAVAWLGKIPEEILVEAKIICFCRGGETFKKVLSEMIKRNLVSFGAPETVLERATDNRYKFGVGSADSNFGYSGMDYFESRNCIEVSPEVFSVIWLGQDVDSIIESEDELTLVIAPKQDVKITKVSVTKLTIKL